MARLSKRSTATRLMGADLMRFVAGNTIGLLAGILTGRLKTSPGRSI